MINCPNCGAPIDPYAFKCSYCGTYVFDTTAWDLDDSKKCFVKFKMGNKTITTLARPVFETIDINYEPTYVCDGLNNKMRSFTSSRNCNIRMRFECYQNPKTKELFRIYEREMNE